MDEMFRALANRHRRRILLRLLEETQPAVVDVEDLTANQPQRDREQRLSLQFYHSHLPKLDHLDLVDWNRQQRTVRRGPAFDEIRPLLELLSSHEDDLPETLC